MRTAADFCFCSPHSSAACVEYKAKPCRWTHYRATGNPGNYRCSRTVWKQIYQQHTCLTFRHLFYLFCSGTSFPGPRGRFRALESENANGPLGTKWPYNWSAGLTCGAKSTAGRAPSISRGFGGQLWPKIGRKPTRTFPHIPTPKSRPRKHTVHVSRLSVGCTNEGAGTRSIELWSAPRPRNEVLPSKPVLRPTLLTFVYNR